jgi:urease accessory protein
MKPLNFFFEHSRAIGVAALLWLCFAMPAQAHHAMGGTVPQTFGEGLLSGLAHPVIGIDHFVFVMATGLLAIGIAQGWRIPLAFATTAMVGTGFHLAGFTAPVPEVWISASVLGAGLLLALRHSLKPGPLVGLAAIAGLFHGYGYGEAIFGAEQTALVAYLVGFTLIQLAIALGSFWLGRQWVSRDGQALRFAGFAIAGAGFAFLSSVLVGLAFPLPPGA